jgi:hypothetical protein
VTCNRVKFRQKLNDSITLLNERLICEEWQLHQISSMWKTLDAINICRPCPRDYSITLALADRDKDELCKLRPHHRGKRLVAAATTAVGAITTAGGGTDRSSHASPKFGIFSTLTGTARTTGSSDHNDPKPINSGIRTCKLLV